MVPRGVRRTMILLLIIMTPGIPEYMTGSSKLGALILDPASFFVGLVFNIALYSCGALLIREFSLKYGKGWASILTLGLAYGIMEEGISVHTFFLPAGNPVGLLGIYGRYMGVDWIWSLGISVFHSVFSIGLPLLLLSIAYPKYSRERLLGRKGVSAVLAIYALDVLVLNLVVNAADKSSPTPGDYIFFLTLAALLVILAKFLPGTFLKGRGSEVQGTRKFYMLGLLVFPLYAFNAFFPAGPGGAPRLPPVIEAVIFTIGNLLILAAVGRYMPEHNNRKHKFALALGLITPLFVWAELVQLIGIAQIITVVSIIGVIFLLKLRKLVKKGINLEESQNETTIVVI